jgi:hypothetical protein
VAVLSASFLDNAAAASQKSGAGARALQNLSAYRARTLNAKRRGARNDSSAFDPETGIFAQVEESRLTPRAFATPNLTLNFIPFGRYLLAA